MCPVEVSGWQTATVQAEEVDVFSLRHRLVLGATRNSACDVCGRGQCTPLSACMTVEMQLMLVLTSKCECRIPLQHLARVQLGVHALVGALISCLRGLQSKGAIGEELGGWKELVVVEPLQGDCCCGCDGAVKRSRAAHCNQQVLGLLHKLCSTRQVHPNSLHARTRNMLGQTSGSLAYSFGHSHY